MKTISPHLTRLIAAPLFLSAVLILLTPVSLTAQAQPDSAAKRRVLQQNAPVYPSLARGMALAGIVRVDAVVGPDGIVKSVSIKGGHPVLAQAAAEAVRRWKWEAGPRESHEAVEVKFDP
jgi:TonB family protein